MNLWIGRRGIVTDLRDIHRIEQVMIAAVIAVHVDFAFFRQNAVPSSSAMFQRARATFA